VKALVLAGGLGTRLKPRFGDVPKPLAPVGGRPFLVRLVEWLGAHGLTEVVLCVGTGADQLERALGDGSRQGVRISYSREKEPLGTGGALGLLRGAIHGPVLVVNGDTLPEMDPWDLERARWERGAVGAIGLFQVEDAGAVGRVECDDLGRVTRFVEKDGSWKGPAWVNGGCYAFDHRLWDWIPNGASSLERDVLPRLAAEGELHGHRVPGAFFDIGTPEGWERTERRFGGR
jgi:NDP-sugar pyrophosphorylase family protein